MFLASLQQIHVFCRLKGTRQKRQWCVETMIIQHVCFVQVIVSTCIYHLTAVWELLSVLSWDTSLSSKSVFLFPPLMFLAKNDCFEFFNSYRCLHSFVFSPQLSWPWWLCSNVIEQAVLCIFALHVLNSLITMEGFYVLVDCTLGYTHPWWSWKCLPSFVELGLHQGSPAVVPSQHQPVIHLLCRSQHESISILFLQLLVELSGSFQFHLRRRLLWSELAMGGICSWAFFQLCRGEYQCNVNWSYVLYLGLPALREIVAWGRWVWSTGGGGGYKN